MTIPGIVNDVNFEPRNNFFSDENNETSNLINFLCFFEVFLGGSYEGTLCVD